MRWFLCWCLLMFPAAFVSADDDEARWEFEEKLTDGALDESWNDPGIAGRMKNAEASFDPAYEEQKVPHIAGEEKAGYALRYLLPPAEAPGEFTPFKLWMGDWGRWGGGKAAGKLKIKWKAQFSEDFDFSKTDIRMAELFYDERPALFAPRNYEGPRLVCFLREGRQLFIIAWVLEEKLKTGVKISEEWKIDLPEPLKPGEEAAFELDLALNTPPKSKNKAALKLKDVPADGHVAVMLNGKEIFRANKLVLRANDRAWTSFVFGGVCESKAARKKSQWIDYRGLSIAEPK